MQSFAYANPATVQEAVALLAAKWGEADVLAGGTDLLSLMKEHLHTPKRVVNIKNIKELEGIQKTADGIRIGALVTMDELAKNADVKAAAKSLSDAAAGIPSPQIRHMGTVGGDLCQRPRCWYYRQGFGLLAMKDGKSLVPDGANQVPRHLRRRAGLLRQRLQPRAGAGRARRQDQAGVGQGPARSRRRPVSSSCRRTRRRVRSRCTPTRSSPRSSIPAGAVRSATYEVRQKEALDWPLATASVVLRMKRQRGGIGQGRPGARRAQALGFRRGRQGAGR